MAGVQQLRSCLLLVRWGKVTCTGGVARKRSSVPEQLWYPCSRLKRIVGALNSYKQACCQARRACSVFSSWDLTLTTLHILKHLAGCSYLDWMRCAELKRLMHRYLRELERAQEQERLIMKDVSSFHYHEHIDWLVQSGPTACISDLPPVHARQ